MRNLLDKASAAQSLDGDRLKGSLRISPKPKLIPRKPIGKQSVTSPIAPLPMRPLCLTRLLLTRPVKSPF
jgi:hypothetical protein